MNESLWGVLLMVAAIFAAAAAIFAVMLELIEIIPSDMYNNFKSECNNTFGEGNWTEVSYKGPNLSNPLIYTKTNRETVTCVSKEIKGVIKP